MRKRTMAMCGLVLAIGVGVFLVGWFGRPERPSPPLDDLSPVLVVLLQERAEKDFEHKSTFFRTLTELVERHQQTWLGDLPWSLIGQGHAVISADSTAPVVVILRGNNCIVPGSDTQYLLLLNHEGRILDRLACSINNRLTQVFVTDAAVTDADFRTDVIEGDDAVRLVIRFLPANGGNVVGNWSHEIAHDGSVRSFGWDNPAVNWDKLGLCRVAVRDGRFAVVFPKAG